MSLDEEMRHDDFDPDVERLERMLQSTTPRVSPPPLGLLKRIRDRRRRRKQIASGLGALALVAGSISVGLVALQASDSLLQSEAVITTAPDGAPITEADVNLWLTALPPETDASRLFWASSLPRPEVARDFIGCAWVERWRNGLADGDEDTAARALSELMNSEEWAVSQALPPQLEGFAELATSSRFASTSAEAEKTALWQRCSR